MKTTTSFKCSNALNFLYKCNVCAFEVPNKVNLAVHETKKHGKDFSATLSVFSSLRRCPICRWMTTSLLKAIEHVCEQPEEFYKAQKRSYVFRNTDKQTARKPNLKQQLKCKSCNFITGSTRSLTRHVNKRHKATSGETEKQLTCEHCDYSTNNTGLLSNHVQTTHVSACDKGDFTGNSKELLQRHINDKHTAEQHIHWHSCIVCEFKTKDKGVLKEHMHQVHSDSNDNWFLCVECNYKTNESYLLQRHITLRHSPVTDNKKWFNCEFCEKRYIRNSQLTKHIMKNHVDML